MNKIIDEMLVEARKMLETNGDKLDDVQIAMAIAPYSGDNQPDIGKLLKLSPQLREEMFPDAEYPEEKSISMRVITNVQLIIQDEMEKIRVENVNKLEKQTNKSSNKNKPKM